MLRRGPESLEHAQEYGAFSTPPFGPAVPFVGWLANKFAEHHGSLGAVAANVFAHKGVQINAAYAKGEPIPDDELPSANGRGSLLVGCHRGGTEPMFLASIAARSGAETHIFAKPPSMQAQFLATIAARLAKTDTAAANKTMNTILPLTTSRIASDNASGAHKRWQRGLWRAGTRQGLPTSTEIRQTNERTLANGSRYLEAGDAVLIFPSGQVGDATKKRWEPGVGRLMAGIAPEHRGNVDVHLFRMEDYASLRHMAAIALHLPSPKEPVVVNFARPFSVESMIGDKPSDKLHAAVITKALRQRFNEQFAPVKKS